LKKLRTAVRNASRKAGDTSTDGGAGTSTNGGAVVDGVVDAQDGGANADGDVIVLDSEDSSDVALADFISLVAYTNLPDPIDTLSLDHIEPEALWNHCLISFTSSDSFFANTASSALSAGSKPTYLSKVLDLSRAPQLYAEAMARPDAAAWRAAMEREKTSLSEMGAFEEVDLPIGTKTIGLKWVYAYKKNAEGINILEKARVVAQGFNQRPGQFDETYAPVAKMTSVRVLLTWAAVRDLEIYQFDCKTAFLHAKIRHPNYA
jgi:hypothetical protein